MGYGVSIKHKKTMYLFTQNSIQVSLLSIPCWILLFHLIIGDGKQATMHLIYFSLLVINTFHYLPSYHLFFALLTNRKLMMHLHTWRRIIRHLVTISFCRNIQVAYLGFSTCKSTRLLCAIHAPQQGQQFWQKTFSIQDIWKEFSYLQCIYYHLTRGTGIWKPLLPKCTAPVLTVLFKGALEHYFLKMLLTQVTHERMNHYHALMAKSVFSISLLI